MKAITYHNYGAPDVLELEEVEEPTPGDNQVLIAVRAASLNALDWHRLSADIFLVRLMGGGFFKPRDQRLGSDVAGRVEAVGNGVTRFRRGDEVFGIGAGTFAEYACALETHLASKSSAMTFEIAATVPVAALTALQGLRDHGRVQSGQRVLIQGASGGVGNFAVQIAKALGAEVTAVCSTRNLNVVRSLGADHVVDYTQEDFTRTGQRYDLILAINGYHPIWAYRRALNSTGIFVLVGACNTHLFRAMFEAVVLGPVMSIFGRRKMGVMGMATMNQKDLAFLKDLVESGKLVPIIDKCYPLSEVAEAFRYLEQEHAQGKVVITVPSWPGLSMRR